MFVGTLRLLNFSRSGIRLGYTTRVRMPRQMNMMGIRREIVRALDAGANAQKIAEHLGWIVRERMELPSDPIHDLKIAEEMVSFWAQWREGTDPTKT
jgi:hypothetical protein